MKRQLAALSLLAALAAGPVGASVVLLDNTTNAPYSGGPAPGTNNGIKAGDPNSTPTVSSSLSAFGFDVGSTSHTIDQIDVMVASITGSSVVNGDLTVRLLKANNILDNPSNANVTEVASRTLTGLTFADITSLTSANATSINTSTSGTGTGSWTLATNTRYFLQFTSSNWNDARLVRAEPDAGYSTGTSGLTFVGRYFSSQWGNSYGSVNQVNIPWMKVQDLSSGGGSSVPDAGPGPALALLLGGLGLRQWRSSRRSRTAA